MLLCTHMENIIMFRLDGTRFLWRWCLLLKVSESVSGLEAKGKSYRLTASCRPIILCCCIFIFELYHKTKHWRIFKAARNMCLDGTFSIFPSFIYSRSRFILKVVLSLSVCLSVWLACCLFPLSAFLDSILLWLWVYSLCPKCGLNTNIFNAGARSLSDPCTGRCTNGDFNFRSSVK